MGKNKKSKTTKDATLEAENKIQDAEATENENNEVASAENETETVEETKNNSIENEETSKETKEKEAEISAKKKKLKKALKIVILTFLSLGLLVVVLPYVVRWLHPADQTVECEDWRFFEPDYEKNIFEDEVYMSLNRNVYFKKGGIEQPVTSANRAELDPVAGFFYDYIDCLIRGDYEAYPSFYTEKCQKDPNFKCPEKFTMQGIYDIHIEYYDAEKNEKDEVVSELYFVSYRIFENNGTYRKDILPDDTNTRVFEITLGTPLINSITLTSVHKD